MTRAWLASRNGWGKSDPRWRCSALCGKKDLVSKPASNSPSNHRCVRNRNHSGRHEFAAKCALERSV